MLDFISSGFAGSTFFNICYKDKLVFSVGLLKAAKSHTDKTLRVAAMVGDTGPLFTKR